MVCIMTYRKEHPRELRKVADVSSERDLSTVERAWLVSQHFGGKTSAQWVNTWSRVRSEGNMTGSNVLSPRLT
jgi:hypothetical protein